MEIIRDDGSISNDLKEVLCKWQRDISNLYSGIRSNPSMAYDDEFYAELGNEN